MSTLINLLLKDQCSVTRATSTIINGTEVRTYSEVASSVPCQVVPQSYDAQQDQGSDVQLAALATAYFLPDQDIRAQDSITTSSGTVWTVLGRGGAYSDLYGSPSHREYLCREVVQP